MDGGPKPNLKPCFHRQIGLCPGVCSGEISKKDYKKIVSNLVLFLSGKKKRLLNKLAKESPKKAKALRYLKDAALIIREEEIPLGDSSRIEGYDISHFAGRETYGSMVVFENGEENKKEYRLFKIKEAGASFKKYFTQNARRSAPLRSFGAQTGERKEFAPRFNLGANKEASVLRKTDALFFRGIGLIVKANDNVSACCMFARGKFSFDCNSPNRSWRNTNFSPNFHLYIHAARGWTQSHCNRVGG